MKNTVIFFVLSMGMLPLYAQDLPIHHMDEQAIEQHIKMIERTCKRDRFIKAGLAVTSGVMQVVELIRAGQFFYGWLTKKKEKDIVEHAKKISLTPDLKSIQANMPNSSIKHIAENTNRSLMPDLKSMQKNMPETPISLLNKQYQKTNITQPIIPKEPFLTRMKNFLISQEAISIILFSCSSYATQKLVERFWHPESLHWFVKNKVPFVATCMTMREYLNVLVRPGVPLRQKKFAQQSIINLTNLLVLQIEQIVAFMMYKEVELLEEKKAMAASVIRYIFNRTNDFSLTINNMLQKKEYNGILKELSSFEAELKREIKHFACIEGKLIIKRYISHS